MALLTATAYLKEHCFDVDEDDPAFYLELFIKQKGVLVRMSNTENPRIFAVMRVKHPQNVSEELFGSQKIGSIRNLPDMQVPEAWIDSLLTSIDLIHIPIKLPINNPSAGSKRSRRSRDNKN